MKINLNQFTIAVIIAILAFVLMAALVSCTTPQSTPVQQAEPVYMPIDKQTELSAIAGLFKMCDSYLQRNGDGIFLEEQNAICAAWAVAEIRDHHNVETNEE